MQVAPLIGISIGDKFDNTTWRIDYAPEATQEQIAAAESILKNFDFNGEPVPKSIKMWQAKIALSQIGKLDAANALIAQLGPPITIAWEYASDLSRNSPGMLGIAMQIGLNDTDLDNLFIAADKIRV